MVDCATFVTGRTCSCQAIDDVTQPHFGRLEGCLELKVLAVVSSNVNGARDAKGLFVLSQLDLPVGILSFAQEKLEGKNNHSTGRRTIVCYFSPASPFRLSIQKIEK